MTKKLWGSKLFESQRTVWIDCENIIDEPRISLQKNNMSTPSETFFQTYSPRIGLQNGLLELQEWLEWLGKRDPDGDNSDNIDPACIPIIHKAIINKYMASQALPWCSHYLQEIQRHLVSFCTEFLAMNPNSYGELKA